VKRRAKNASILKLNNFASFYFLQKSSNFRVLFAETLYCYKKVKSGNQIFDNKNGHFNIETLIFHFLMCDKNQRKL